MLKSPPSARKCLLETSGGLKGHPRTIWDPLGATCFLAQKHSYLNGASPEVCSQRNLNYRMSKSTKKLELSHFEVHKET